MWAAQETSNRCAMKFELQSREANTEYSSKLETGDYIPYFCIENGSRKLDIQVKAGRFLLLLLVPSSEQELLQDLLKLETDYQQFIITDAETNLSNHELFFDANVFRLFADRKSAVTAVICNKNLKICGFWQAESLDELVDELPPMSSLPYSGAPPPVLLVPHVISDDLSNRLIAYFDRHEAEAHANNSDFKTRLHIHPDKGLMRELDDKLSKSLLPEIKKVLFSDISHRETYKICCYAAEEDGHFGKHRDTIEPYLHRRYAMTLVLNDDFEGGGVSFPEYTDEVMAVPRNWAVIFPGSLYHQVNSIGVGRRYVVISFFFTENEAAIKQDSERYRFQIQRDLCGIKIHKITPDIGG